MLVDPRLANFHKPKVSCIETVKLYDNKTQMDVSHNIIIYLNQLAGKGQAVEGHNPKDIARGALVSAVKFNVQARYEANKLNFTNEDVKAILKEVEQILKVQVDSMYQEQVFPH